MRTVFWVASAFFLIATAACAPRLPEPVSAFQGRLSDWTREILADSPELASQAGVSAQEAGGNYADRLDDRSALALDARRSAAIRRYAELRALDTAALSSSERLTYDVLSEQFEGASDSAAFDYGNFFPMGDGAGARGTVSRADGCPDGSVIVDTPSSLPAAGLRTGRPAPTGRVAPASRGLGCCWSGSGRLRPLARIGPDKSGRRRTLPFLSPSPNLRKYVFYDSR